jgi:outer membrane protein TolC
LTDELTRHPAVLAAEASINARIAGVHLAEERNKPGWAVDLGYGFRDGFMPDGSPRSDFVSLSVTVDLPFFRKNRQDRELGAALSERRAAKDSRAALLRNLASQLEAEFARCEALTRRIELHEQRILIQAEDQSNSALAAYRSEAGDFADVMRGVIVKLNAQLDIARLQTERAQSYAVLADLGGISR